MDIKIFWGNKNSPQWTKIKHGPRSRSTSFCYVWRLRMGAALIHSQNGLNKMNLISAKSRLFTQAEIRVSSLLRECTAITNTLTEYEFLFLGSKHPTVLITDHKSMIFLFTHKSNPHYIVLRFQLILMKFHIFYKFTYNLDSRKKVCIAINS